ncbi:MAG: VWA domain-containing protein, partial [Candidatus Acidiferrales bacterium]
MKKYFAAIARSLRWAVLLAGAIASGAWLAIPARARQQQSAGAIRVQTDLVNILASVTDANGRPVLGLGQDAFQLSEEGVPQTIARFEAQTNRPLDLALMVDASASTYKDLKFELDAAAHFIAQVVRPGDTLGVFEITENVTQLSDFSADVPQLQQAA